MIKKIAILTLLCAALLSSCMEDVSDARYYRFEVNMAAPQGVALSDVTWSKITVVDHQTGRETTYPQDGTNPLELNLKAGQYGLRLIALSADLTFNGLASASVYNDGKITIQMNKGGQNGLIFKEIYSAGCKPTADSYGYWHDGFVELYNNSDETVYLDGIIVGIVDGGLGNPSPWMTGGLLPDFYPLTNLTFYFPGSGQEYPLAPRTGIVIATKAIDHSTTFDAWGPGQQAEIPMLDLRTADWEFYDNSAGSSDLDNPNVPNLKVMNKLFGIDFMPAVAGQSLILARIPGTYGTAIENFAKDPANKSPKPGATYNNCLKIPSAYVFEGVDVTQAPVSKRTNKLLLTKDDVGMVWYDDIAGKGEEGSYSGKSICRKVIGLTAENKPIYQDSNNSSEDFTVGGKYPPTPGQHPAPTE